MAATAGEQLVPAGAQDGPDRTVLPPGRSRDKRIAQTAHQRDDAHQEDQGVGDENPGQQKPDQDGTHGRAGHGDDQPGEQQRDRRADVTEGQQQGTRRDAEWGANTRAPGGPSAASAAGSRGTTRPGQQHGEDPDQRYVIAAAMCAVSVLHRTAHTSRRTGAAR